MSFKKGPVEAERAYSAILEAIGRIEEFMAGFTIEQFTIDKKTVSAVCYEFVTIGERINDLNKENYFAQSPFNDRVAWEQIGKIRHFLSHEYYGDINVGTLWKTVQKNVPILKEAIEWHLQQVCNQP